MRICNTCLTTKPLEAFHKNASRTLGVGECCKVCAITRSRKYVAENRTSLWEKNIKKRFGITPAVYFEMLEKQNGVCKICKMPETTVKRGRLQRLAVDHCHATKKVRGLLCNKCNRGIGYFQDSIELLETTIRYLEC